MLGVLPMPGHLGEWATTPWNAGQLTMFQVCQVKSLDGKRGSPDPMKWEFRRQGWSPQLIPTAVPLKAFLCEPQGEVRELREAEQKEGLEGLSLSWNLCTKHRTVSQIAKHFKLLPLKILLFIMKTASQAIMRFLHPGHWKHFKQCWQQ